MHTKGFCRTSSSAVRVLVFAFVLAWVSGCDDEPTPGHVAQNSRRAGEQSDGGHPVAPAEDAGRSVVVAPDVGAAGHCRGHSPVATENCLQGTASWQLKNAAEQHEVEGYASTVSAAAGDVIGLFVNVDHKQRVRWELYRHGYYQGLGGRFVAAGDSAVVSPQPSCPLDTDNGRIECSWSRAFKVKIDPIWITGYYTFKLINEAGLEAEIPLIIRESGRRAPLLMQATVTTWQAYNVWGGTSFYKNLLPPGSGFTPNKASEVSFDRPYSSQNALPAWLAAVAWIEKKGYDVAYVTNLDSDDDSGLLSDRKVFLSAGHDEYVTQAEHDELIAARDRGVSLIFASANDIYRHVELAASTTGVPMRVMYRAKGGFAGGGDSEILGNSWDNWTNRFLLPFVATRADHWIYEGTGVKDFDVLGNVVGAEWQTVKPDKPEPPGLEIVSASPTIMTAGFPRFPSNATVYYPTADSLVFSAATICWGFGLSDMAIPNDLLGAADPRFQRMTENVLKRAGLPPIEPTIVEPPALVEPGSQVEARVIAGGTKLDPNGGAPVQSLDAPVGLAVGPDGLLYVADSSGFIRRISADGQVVTLAGCSPDAPEGSPCVNLPIGIAVSPAGTVYFSDASENQIFKLTPDGIVTLYAGASDMSEGSADASDPLQASFAEPRGLALGPGGELYVADANNGSIRRIDEAGVTTVARDVPGVAALALGDNGNLYFSSMNCQVGEIASGEPEVLACPSGLNGNREGPGAEAHLRPMEGLLVDGDRLVFADTGNSRLRAVELDGSHDVSTVVGDDNVNPDLGSGTHLALPRGVVSYQGGYAISDSANHRILWVPSR